MLGDRISRRGVRAKACKCPRGSQMTFVGDKGIRCQKKNGRFVKTPKACNSKKAARRKLGKSRRPSRSARETCRGPKGKFVACRKLSSHERTMLAARRSPGRFAGWW